MDLMFMIQTGVALAVAATAAPFASSAADRLLTDKDLKKVSGKVSDWYEAIAEGNPVRRCPRCSNPGFVRIEGCDTCVSCGYSKCG